ncbi:tetratricopeptide repeat protein [Kribbella ginsengisoli]|uniref:XRE family transcriptional regulator n=1 Tax=Kribbella ginsengisoli TaxID=363865 RepID=A0ABP6YBH9_9ACTN
MNDRAEFGGLLRRYRRAANLTQAALAEAAGLSEQAIGLLERGIRRRPHRGTVLALTGAMGLDARATANLLSAAGGQEAGEAPARVAPERVPRQLPPDVGDFVGRSEELSLLTNALGASAHHAGTTVVALHGLAGVGKTTLAVHAAHLAADDFPGGQLYIDLQGYGPGAPLTASSALRVLLYSLGVRELAVPGDVEAATALYRSLLAGTRTLVVLDNGSDVDVLTHLLPGDAHCAVLVTGRRAMNLPSGCTNIELAPLDDADSLTMLSCIIGAERVGAEADAARTIVSTSHGLPLIVRLVGARLDRRQDWELAQVAQQLRSTGRRIDHLGVTAAVHSTVASSLEQLLSFPGGAQRQAAVAFDFLGLVDAPELSGEAVAALLDLSAQSTEDVMAHLVDLHLVGSPRPGWYRLHDLLRAVARERANSIIDPAARKAAVDRILALYLARGWECLSLTHRKSDRLDRARLPVAQVAAESLTERLAWFDAEFATVLALAEQLAALDGEYAESLVELALALFGYLEIRSRWPELRDLTAICRPSAVSAEDQAWFDYQAGIPDWEQGHFEAALVRFSSAMNAFHRFPDPRSESRTAFAVARTLEKLGRFEEAIPYAERALATGLQAGYRYGQGTGLLALGTLLVRVGRTEEAESRFAAAIELATEDGDTRSIARRQGLIGEAYAAAGDHQRAIDRFKASLELHREAPDPNGVVFVHRRLGTSLLASGETETAAEILDVALELAKEGSDRTEEAKILTQLGELQLVLDHPDAAREYLGAAASLFEDLGMPEAVDVRSRLASLV